MLCTYSHKQIRAYVYFLVQICMYEISVFGHQCSRNRIHWCRQKMPDTACKQCTHVVVYTCMCVWYIYDCRIFGLGIYIWYSHIWDMYVCMPTHCPSSRAHMPAHTRTETDTERERLRDKRDREDRHGHTHTTHTHTHKHTYTCIHTYTRTDRHTYVIFAYDIVVYTCTCVWFTYWSKETPSPRGVFFLGWFPNEVPGGKGRGCSSSGLFIWKPPQKEEPSGRGVSRYHYGIWIFIIYIRYSRIWVQLQPGENACDFFHTKVWFCEKYLCVYTCECISAPTHSLASSNIHSHTY